MRFNLRQPQHSQSGQTMIEVIIALFMLTMALVAGLGLAIYSNSRNVNNRNQLIATNLAREGIEGVRILRDTNWLAAEDPTPTGGTINAGVDDLDPSCNFGGGVFLPCYPEAFGDPYDLQSSNNNNDYRLVMTGNGRNPYLTLDTRNGQETYLLCLMGDGSYRHSTCSAAQAQFARRVSITTGNTSAPFTNDHNNPSASNGHSPEKIVTSVVIWKGKGCVDFPSNVVPTTFNTPCKVTVVERLTNWKDYR